MSDYQLRHFNPSSNLPHRAHQAWMILVGMAMNRQTTTYKALSVLMYGKEASGVLGNILGHIAYFCEDHDLPQLNVIVVSKGKGVPGDLIPLEPNEVDAVREAVYATNWYDIVPPSPQALAEAYGRRQFRA
ncbi:MAG: hypothetical protein LDL26_04035 [Caenispirillum bisanense]|nr:hypothetical protein [Caenispirillum bisanense]MCA1972925.1 hypothetical protein [Caenispirillum sp.]